MDDVVELREVTGHAGAACREILDLLPTWFGVPEANQDYIDTAETHPGVLATVGGEPVGITTIKQHSPYAAEIYLMAVKPAHHRHGIGSLMLSHVESRLARDDVEFLQVKTLSPAVPTRATRRRVRSGWRAASVHSKSSRPCGAPPIQPCSSSRPCGPCDRRTPTPGG